MHRSARKMERAVLVDIRQFTELPERGGLVLPCRKRLPRFDQVCRIPSDSMKHGFSPALKPCSGFENRELDLGTVGRGTTGRVDHKLVDKVIECRAEIVDDFSNQDAPNRWTWFFHDHPNRQVDNMG